jgi:hypothetical protein
MPMVIVNIIGGLGNQMFQFAAARALAIRKGVPLKLDVSGFDTYSLHQGFELGSVFNIKMDLAESEDVRKILGWQSSPRIRGLFSRRRFAVFRSSKHVIEPSFEYWHGMRNSPSDCYLKGYWQSEKYFYDVAELIRKDFAFRQLLDNKNAECAALISEVNAVSLHVRRGDYASHASTAATHGLCSIEYYRAALQLVAERVPNAHLFIFSDDICWVKKNLPLDLPFHYVDHNHGEYSFNDMRLMSMCKHNIIANSSFGWWGAWLNPRVDKIVVAPRRWFNIDNCDTRDIYCSSWVVL